MRRMGWKCGEGRSVEMVRGKDEKENRAEDHTGDGVEDEDKDRKVEKARGEQ